MVGNNIKIIFRANNRKGKRGSVDHGELELTNGEKSLRILKRGRVSGEKGEVANGREEERANGEGYG